MRGNFRPNGGLTQTRCIYGSSRADETRLEQIDRITGYPVGHDRDDRVAGIKTPQKPDQLRPLRISATELLVEYPIASGCLQPFNLPA